MAKTIIRPATSLDFPILLEIDAASFPAGVAYDSGELSYFMNQEGAETIVLEMDGSIAAFLIVDVDLNARSAMIVTLDVREDCRRLGFGSRLIVVKQDHAASDTVPAGNVISTSPAPNTAAPISAAKQIDLTAVFPISQIIIQADSNDTYQVDGSTDGGAVDGSTDGEVDTLPEFDGVTVGLPFPPASTTAMMPPPTSSSATTTMTMIIGALLFGGVVL